MVTIHADYEDVMRCGTNLRDKFNLSVFIFYAVFLINIRFLMVCLFIKKAFS